MLSKSVGFYIFISRQKLITLLSMQLTKHYSQHQMYVCINYFDFKIIKNQHRRNGVVYGLAQHESAVRQH